MHFLVSCFIMFCYVLCFSNILLPQRLIYNGTSVFLWFTPKYPPPLLPELSSPCYALVLKGLFSSQIWLRQDNWQCVDLCPKTWHSWAGENGGRGKAGKCIFVFLKARCFSYNGTILTHTYTASPFPPPVFLWAFIFSFQENKHCLLSRSIEPRWKTTGYLPEIVSVCVVLLSPFPPAVLWKESSGAIWNQAQGLDSSIHLNLPVETQTKS